MKLAAERIAHYNNRMTSSQIDPVLAAVNQTAKDNFAAYAVEWVALQIAVHGYLSAQGVNPQSWFLYDGFAGEIFHISKRATGPAAVLIANDMCLKWELLGGGLPKLKGIAALFGIIVP